jgi:hypothetical protein
MSILQASKRAEEYYNAARSKTLVSGFEKTIVTDGENCIFSSSDYELQEGEYMFQASTRNGNTVIKTAKKTEVNKTKTINVDLPTQERKLLRLNGENLREEANVALQTFLYLNRAFLKDIKGLFTREEIIAILDNFNGTMYKPQWAIIKEGYIASLEDGDELDNLGARQNCDITKLIDKIRNLSIIHVALWQYEIYRFWNTEYYKNDIDNFVNTFK